MLQLRDTLKKIRVIEAIMNNSYNYETIRINSIKALNMDVEADNEREWLIGISERYRIFFNPKKFIDETYLNNSLTIEDIIFLYLDVEIIDYGFGVDLADEYKSAFSKSLSRFISHIYVGDTSELI